MTKSHTEKKQCDAQGDAQGEAAELPLFELLEPRVLYSADALGVGAVLLPDDTSSTPSDYASAEQASDTDPADEILADPLSDTYGQTIEIVFIDSRVPNAETFIDAWASSNVQFVLIDETEDALTTISQYLDTVSQSDATVSTLRIVSHGGDGFLQLGNENIDENALNENAHLLAEWSEAMTGEADILLYGCNVAQTATGFSFIEALAELTDADVAASDDVTGNANQGGDWVLEVSYGATSDYSAIDTQRMAAWTNTLAVINVSYSGDDVDTMNDTLTIADLDNLDNVSLRAAIVAANNTPGHDSIHFGTNEFILNDVLVIDSQDGSSDIVFRNFGNNDVVIRHAAGVEAGFLQIKNGHIRIQGDSNNSGSQIIFEGARRPDPGGAINVEQGASLFLNNIRFQNNQAIDNGTLLAGGAIFSEGEINVQNSLFATNLGSDGGAIAITNSAPSFSITDSAFVFNDAFPSLSNLFTVGGAIEANAPGTIDGSLFSDNFSSSSGGAVYTSQTLTVTDTQFTNNSSSEGGAIFGDANVNIIDSTFSNQTQSGAVFSTESVEVSGSTFTNNNMTFSASGGGAIHADKDVVVNSSEFIDNSARNRGGAIFAGLTADISNSHFQGNEAIGIANPIAGEFASAGGAIFSLLGGSITNSSFVGNTAEVGSATFSTGGPEVDENGDPEHTLTINNATFSNNVTVENNHPGAASQGTVVVAGFGGLEVSFSTFADNESDDVSAGIIALDDATASVGSSIFSNNTVVNGVSHGQFSNVTSDGFIVADATLTLNITDDNFPLSIFDPSLSLGALTTQAGGIVQARPLLSGSSAINAGSSASNGTDSLGQPIDGIPDAGAFEFQGGDDILYWADDDGNIWRSNTDFPDPILIEETDHTISGLVVDLDGHNNDGGGRILWVNQDTGELHTILLDGTGLGIGGASIVNARVLSNDLDIDGEQIPFNVNSLAFDQDRDFVFVSHSASENQPAAIRVWEVGTDISIFVRQIENPGGYVMENPRDIHFSAATGRLYWVDGETSATNATIHSSNIDGSGYELIYTGAVSDDFHGVVTDENAGYLYFTNQSDNTISRLDLSTNTIANSVTVPDGGSNGLSDITFTTNDTEIVVTNLSNGRIHVYDNALAASISVYDHEATPVVIATASTVAANQPSFHIENFHYTEGAAAQTIGIGQINVDNPSGSAQDVTFSLVSGPELIGGEIFVDGAELSTGGTFDLSQNITYFNDSIVDETSDVFQIQIIENGVPVGPVKAFVVTIAPMDDPATFSINPITVTENSVSAPLNVLDFVIDDEENVTPEAYQVIAVQPSNLNIVPVVNGSDTNFFTHADLVAGNVSINAQNTAITSLNSTTPVTVVLQVQPLVAGSPMALNNPTGPFFAAEWEVNILPVDDQAIVTVNPSNVQIIENTIQPVNGSTFNFQDEESTADDATYTVTDIGDTSLALITLDNTQLMVGATFSHAQLLNGDVSIDTTHANVSGTSESTSFSFQAVTDPTDPSLASASDPFTLTVDVLAANDDPTIAPQTQLLAEGSVLPLTSAMFNFDDEETPDGEVYTLSVESFTRGAEFFIGGVSQGANNGVTFTQAQLDAGLVSFSTANADIPGGPDVEITYGVIVTLTDLSTTQHTQITFRISADNDASVFSFINGEITVLEDSVQALPFLDFDVVDIEGDSPIEYIINTDISSSPFVLHTGDITSPLGLGDTFTQQELMSGVFIDATDTNIPNLTTQTLSLTAVMDNGPSSNSATLTINLVPVNDIPTLSPIDITLDEGGIETLVDSNFGFFDEETPLDAQYTLSTLENLNGAFFTVNGIRQNSTVTFSHAQLLLGVVDFDTSEANIPEGQPYVINFATVAQPSSGPASQSTTFSITVNPVNEDATLSFINNDFTVLENNISPLPFLDFEVTDEEGNQPVSYLINTDLSTRPYTLVVSGNATPLSIGDTFTHAELIAGDVFIDATVADLSVDFFQPISLIAQMDDGSSTAPVPFNITIEPDNDIPTISPINIQMNEGNEVVFDALTFNFFDEETPFDTTYNLASTDNFHGATLNIDGVPQGSNASFTHAQLTAGLVTFHTQNAIIPEGQPTQIIFSVQAVPPTGPFSVAKLFTIEVIPVNEAPTFADPSAPIEVFENSSVALHSSNLLINDEEGDTPVEYIVGTDTSGSDFSILNTSGLTPIELSINDTFSHQDLLAGNIVIDASNADLSAVSTQSVLLTAVTDNGPSSAATPFTIIVNPVNDVPTLAPTDITLNEGSQIIFDAFTFNYFDEETPDNAVYTVATNDNLQGATLNIAGVPQGSNASFTHAQLTTGLVSFDTQNAIIPEGQATTITFVVNVQPSTGPGSTASQLDIDIFPVNEASQLSFNENDFVILENSVTPLPHLDFIITDEEGNQPIEYMIGSNISASPYTLYTASNSTPLVQGDTFSHQDLIDGNVFIDASDADLTTLVSENINLAAVMDDGSSTPFALFNITVVPVDDAPTVSPIDITLDEGDVVVLDEQTFNYQDEETPNSAVYVLATNDNLHGSFLTVDGETVSGTVMFTHQQLVAGLVSFDTQAANIPEGQPTTLNFFVNVNPATGPSSTATQLSITVNPVNELPELSFTNNTLTVFENSSVVLAPSVNVLDEEQDTPVAYQIGSNLDNSPFAVEILGTGTPLLLGDTFSHQDLISGNVIINAANADINTAFSQSVFLTAIMSDGPSSAPVPITVSVIPVNDAATLAPTALTINEGTSTQLNANTFGFADEESNDTSYTLNSISTNNGTELIVNGQALSAGDTFEHQDLLDGGVFVNAQNADILGATAQPVVFSVTAVPDAGPASQPADFVVLVNPTNDSPTVTPVAQVLVENNVLFLNASLFGYSDEENDALSHIVIESFENNSGVTLNLNGMPVADGDTITVAQLNQGLVSLDASAANVGLGDSASIGFYAVDENGVSSESSILNTTVVPENDAATLTAQSIAVSIDEGSTVALSSSNFLLTDEENAGITEYVIQSLPSEAGVTVELNGIALQVDDTFTQQDLDDGSVSVNASDAPVLVNSMDSLNVLAQLDDGTRTNSTNLQLQFNSVEDVPQLTTTSIGSAPEDSVTIVLPEQFSFEDGDGDTLVEYRLESPLSTDGYTLQLDGVVLNAGDTFTQDDLIQGVVTVHSDGTNLDNTIIDQFSVVAISSNGIESNAASVNVLLQPNNDAPILSPGTPIIANENELTTLTPENLLVDDAEGDPATLYTLIEPLEDSVGFVSVNGDVLNTDESFTHDELIAGDVQIDLQALDINEDTVASVDLTVTAGGLTSEPQTIPVIINEANDAPEFALDTPLSLPTLSAGGTVTIPENAFTDSDGDEINYSVVQQLDEEGNTAPLPEWVTFNSDTQEFQLNGEPQASELNILVIANDTNDGEAQTALVLSFDEPELAAALSEPEPEPIELVALESPDVEPTITQVAQAAPAPVAPPPEPEPEPAPERIETISESEPEEASVQSSGNLDDSQITTSNIQGSRIDLASLLPSLNSDTSNISEQNNQSETNDAILSELIGFTNNIDRSDPFQISNFESATYRRSLDNLANRWDDDEALEEPVLININTTVGSSVGLSSGFTVGYMIWLLRGGTLMGSVLSSLPAWRLVDPLPVLAELDGDLDDDNESLESMVNKTNEAEEAAKQSENHNAHH